MKGEQQPREIVPVGKRVDQVLGPEYVAEIANERRLARAQRRAEENGCNQLRSAQERLLAFWGSKAPVKLPVSGEPGSTTYKLIESDREPSADELNAAYQGYLDAGGNPIRAVLRIIEDVRESELMGPLDLVTDHEQ